ncbi:hypothetical protein Tco_1183536 [Tanacetum coccineum]
MVKVGGMKKGGIVAIVEGEAHGALRLLGIDYISHAWAQAQQNNQKAQWTKTKPMPNCLRSGGSKTDEGLPEDTFAGHQKSARQTHIRKSRL